MNQLLSSLALIFLLLACSTDDEPGVATEGTDPDTFDREAMLAHWADRIIVPAYQAYAGKLAELQTATTSFTEAPDETLLATLRIAWLDAYRGWQPVAMFEIGKAEALNLRNFTNIYPANATEIEENIRKENYTLDMPSKNDEQGFPALDYLLYGIADTDAAILARYQDASRGVAYRTYLTEVVNRMVGLTTQVVTDWKGSYRDTFAREAGSSATGSFNKLVNDYLFYYEKALRAGKIGIPAGVFSSKPLPETVEGYYAGVSKVLFMDGLDATQHFFNGRSFGQDANGPGLASYLDYLNTVKEGEKENLVGRINSQFDEARNIASGLNDNFAEQIATDNQALLSTYDALQKNVVLMKVDMFQALNVRVDFVDADGD